MSAPSIKISVLVAVYNGAGTLQRCIDHFASQTYSNKELIIMDGGSTDGTQAILEANNEIFAFWESQPDQGIYHAWNKAITRSSGEWICFLGSDDYFWEDDVLEKMAAQLENLPLDIRIAYGKIAVVSKNGAVLRIEGQPWEEAQQNFKRFMTIPHPGLLHRRCVFDEHGLFDQSFRLAADYDFLLRELKTGKAEFVPEIITVGMQHGGVSNTPTAMGRYYTELTRIHRRHSGIGSISWRFARVNIKIALCALTVRLIGDAGFRAVADMIRRTTGRAPIWNQKHS